MLTHMQDMNAADNARNEQVQLTHARVLRTLFRIPFADMILAPLPDLRAQLAAVINTSQHGPHGYSNNDIHASSSASPHDQNIDPAIGGSTGGGMMSAGGAAGDSGGDDSLGDGRKGGKRELSQSKRAAQNRAAQVSFCRFARLFIFCDSILGMEVS
jgi:hypothetical protein